MTVWQFTAAMQGFAVFHGAAAAVPESGATMTEARLAELGVVGFEQ